MADDLETLREAGLTANEAKLYMLLVQEGRMKATELSKRSGLHRITVYDTLEQLERKGLAGKAEVNGVLAFEASPPSALLTFVDEKRDAIESLLPRLSRSFEGGERTGTSVLYGINGIKMVLEDIVALKAEYRAYHGQLQFFDTLPRSMRLFNEKRKRLGLRTKYILLDVPQSRERAKLMPLAEIRFLETTSVSVGVWWTYADRVVLFILQKNPTTIFIKNEALAKAFQKSFDEMFSKLKKEGKT